MCPPRVRNLAIPGDDGRSGFLRTALSLLVLLAVLVGSWALLIGVVVFVVRVIT